MQKYITVKNARQNNLKNISLKIPRDKLVVITGLSGSGKSSLAFDTIYAEGQRRYVESLSSYARQFLGQRDKPDVDEIDGLSPAVSIDQKSTSRNPRSTVGTVTEIYDYLRLLYARVGKQHCVKCGKEIVPQTVQQIVDTIMSYPEGTKMQVLSPVILGKKGTHEKVLKSIAKDGFVRVRVDGEMREATETIELDRYKTHTIEIVVDRIVIKPGIERRLTDSVELSLKKGGGILALDVIGEGMRLMSENAACPDCGISLEKLSPRAFSFNSPFGACPDCDGLGFHRHVDPYLVAPDRSKSINQGAIVGFTGANGWRDSLLKGLAETLGFSLNTPLCDLTEKQLNILFNGTEEPIRIVYTSKYTGYTKEYITHFEGIVKMLERKYNESTSDHVRAEMEEFFSDTPCKTCGGKRLKKESLAVTVGGINIADLTAMSVEKIGEWFDNLKLSERDEIIARMIIKEIRARLKFLKDVGLDYLTLDRSATTLAGGEAQRIRLATQIGSGLTGVLYVLDEPSIGLHQRDNRRLIDTLLRLRDLGNTVIVVEHDEETIASADHIIDIGPDAGEHGGEVVAEGTLEDVKASKRSYTGQYMSGKLRIDVPEKRRTPKNFITVRGACGNNLKNIDVDFPLGVLCCVTGVSGSGKSTLVQETLYERLVAEFNKVNRVWSNHKSIEGLEHIDKVIDINQSPIGRTPRSNPATYTGVFGLIRELFSKTPEAKARGYMPGRFSFNVKGGRCEACKGDGVIKIEMQFLPDVYVPCEACHGARFNRETLDIKYKGKSIADVLNMTAEEALKFFENIPKIKRRMEMICQVGLGYMKLGQPATTLSGGEAQRVKLSTELAKRATGKTLYLLDEPTTGLHFHDVKKLLEVLQKLVDAGNSVLVIEHNLDVIKTADYIIDMG
ncbi:MAG: excinuclease ABC subunit UvrA, partial [Abditibacteriota bacterium]|nr:excinuclease ABC subunit UvrA [Abditibacteriota bacterium]